MRAKPALSMDACGPQPREQRLESFLADALERAQGARRDAVLIVARSPESVVTRLVFALSHALAERAIGAQIVFAASAAIAFGETWKLSFHPGFRHETRMIADPRFLAAHEQLVVGDDALWFGDGMRRDPEKRDAFSSYSRCPIEVQRSRRMFARLWSMAEPIYTHGDDQAMPAPSIAQHTADAIDVIATTTSDDPMTWLTPERS